MIKIRNESDLRNWFKKNYKKLGFSKIVKSNTSGFPDFIMLKNGEEINIELETKSSNFILHKHPTHNVNVLCILEDVKLEVPTIVMGNIRLMKFEEGDSRYSFKKQILKLFKKNKILTISETASLLKISYGAAEKALMELVIDKKVERIKKEGVTLWLPK
jgi:predicted HTH transcriptional regulator